MKNKCLHVFNGIAIILAIFMIASCLSVPVKAATYTYDALGRVTSVGYDNGQRIDYSYDSGGNILGIPSKTC